jgi:hypothetical protein
MNRLIDETVRCGFVTAWRLRRFSDQRLAAIRKGHHAGRQPIAFRVRNYFDFGSLHDGDHRIRGAQVDPNDFFTLSHLSKR